MLISQLQTDDSRSERSAGEGKCGAQYVTIVFVFKQTTKVLYQRRATLFIINCLLISFFCKKVCKSYIFATSKPFHYDFHMFTMIIIFKPIALMFLNRYHTHTFLNVCYIQNFLCKNPVCACLQLFLSIFTFSQICP